MPCRQSGTRTARTGVDEGLGGFRRSAGEPAEVYEAEPGNFKVPTLRNVDLRPSGDFVKAYTHNGYFKSIDEIILLYAWCGLVMNGGPDMNGMGVDGCSGGGMGGMNPGMMCGPNLFPAPEVDQNISPMNHFNMMDQANIAIFLKTLSDGYFER